MAVRTSSSDSSACSWHATRTWGALALILAARLTARPRPTSSSAKMGDRYTSVTATGCGSMHRSVPTPAAASASAVRGPGPAQADNGYRGCR